tara:strand:+ start:2734 stop:4266 length:1533 start_codon:yes stop_codon:yes gene_type:complete
LLPYVGKHFWEIYGQEPIHFGKIRPISPTLGMTAFAAVGQTVYVEYLADASARMMFSSSLTLRLIPKGQKDCTKGGCVSLGKPSDIAMRYVSKNTLYVKGKIVLPAGVKPGYYDLLHTLQSFLFRARRQRQQNATTKPSKKTSTRSVRTKGAILVLNKKPKEIDNFQFVHMSDLRFSAGHKANATRSIEGINKLKPAPTFVVLTGDVVQYGNSPSLWKQARALLSKLKMPVIVSIGNNDYYRAWIGQPPKRSGIERQEEGLRLFVRYMHPFLAGRFAFGGYKWMLLDTGPSATYRTWYKLKWVTTEGLTKGQLKDVASFLKTPARNGHIVLGHSGTRLAIRHTSKGCAAGRHGVFLRGRDAFEALLIKATKKTKKPVVYMYGHQHWNDLYAYNAASPSCSFSRMRFRYTMMGSQPCWRTLPVKRSPLLMATQSASKHQSLRSGGWHQWGMKYGEGAGASHGFRVISVKKTVWKSMNLRFYRRRSMFATKYTHGYITPNAFSTDKLPVCSK